MIPLKKIIVYGCMLYLSGCVFFSQHGSLDEANFVGKSFYLQASPVKLSYFLKEELVRYGLNFSSNTQSDYKVHIRKYHRLNDPKVMNSQGVYYSYDLSVRMEVEVFKGKKSLGQRVFRKSHMFHTQTNRTYVLEMEQAELEQILQRRLSKEIAQWAVYRWANDT